MSCTKIDGRENKMTNNTANTPQPAPVGDGEVVLFQVQADILERAAMGRRKYGTFLRTQNGRNSLADAYQEAIDLVMYLCQLQMDLATKDEALHKLLTAIADWILEDEDINSPQHAKFHLIRTYQDTKELLGE